MAACIWRTKDLLKGRGNEVPVLVHQIITNCGTNLCLDGKMLSAIDTSMGWVILSACHFLIRRIAHEMVKLEMVSVQS